MILKQARQNAVLMVFELSRSRHFASSGVILSCSTHVTCVVIPVGERAVSAVIYNTADHYECGEVPSRVCLICSVQSVVSM